MTTNEVRLLDDGSDAREFIPGTGRTHTIWAYDLMTRAMRVGRYQDRLIDLAGIRPGDRVLDIGCGTGNLSLRAARAGGVVTGIDPDRGALERAARKARRAGVGMTLVRGYADRLPGDEASLDHVVSSFALHHIPTDQKVEMASAVARLLRPGGTVTVVDMADGHGRASRRAGRAFVSDNHDHGLERLLAQAGLVDVRELERAAAMSSTLTYVQARKA